MIIYIVQNHPFFFFSSQMIILKTDIYIITINNIATVWLEIDSIITL